MKKIIFGSLLLALGVQASTLAISGGRPAENQRHNGFDKVGVKPVSQGVVPADNKYSAADIQKLRNKSIVGSIISRGRYHNYEVAPAAKVKRPAATAISEGKAKVTLIDNMDWKDGTGYQLLLDADANTFGTEISLDTRSFKGADYSNIEYFIPENADMSASNGNWVSYGESLSVEIPAGTYDWGVVNPFTFNGTTEFVIPVDGAGDDLEIKAGFEYIFSVNPYSNTDKVLLDIITPQDLEVQKIAVVGSTPYSTEETITATLFNHGSEIWNSPCSLTLTVDGNVLATEEIESVNIQPGKTFVYEFKAKADLSADGKHIIKVELAADDDALADNNIKETTVNQALPLDAPVEFTFDSKEEFDQYWMIISPDEEAQYWMYLDKPYNGEQADHCVAFNSYHGEATAANLTTRSSVKLKKGDNYFSFKYKARMSFYSETLEVLYGESQNPAEMERLCIIEDFNNEVPATMSVPFSLDEDKNLFFSFRVLSQEPCFGGSIDDVMIGTGKFVGTPDVVISNLTLPKVSSLLTDEEYISVSVTNNGSDDIQTMKLSYTVNGGEAVEELFTFDNPLQFGDSELLEFNQPIDMSVPGEYFVEINAYDVTSSSGIVENDSDTGNNTVAGRTHKMGKAELPFYTDFSNGVVSKNWASAGNLWEYNADLKAITGNNNTALKSASVPLEGNKAYRFSMKYRAGELQWGIFPMNPSFYVMYGNVSTGILEWKEITYQDYIFTEDEFVVSEWEFVPDSDGDYEFAIVPEGQLLEYLWISNISVEQLKDFDVRVTDVSAPAMIPAEQTSEFNVSASYVNKGAKTLDLKLSLEDAKLGEIGSREVKEIASGTSDSGNITAKTQGAEPGFVFDMTVAPSITSEKADGANLRSFKLDEVVVTDSILAYDRVTEAMLAPNKAIGSSKGALGCGVLFNIATADILTGVSIGWAGDAPQNVSVDIYKYDVENNVLGDQVVATDVDKELGLGFVTYPLSRRMLEAGDYIAVVTFSGNLMSADATSNGKIYVIDENKDLHVQEGLGTPGIRLVFGKGQVLAKDLAVTAIKKPAAKGAYTDKEPVVAEIENCGTNAMTGRVILSVDGNIVSEKTIEVASYSKLSVEFSADLSAMGTHSLAVSVEAQGDEVPGNNEMVKTVTCVDANDPYVLDFEFCEDFCLDGFIPAWKSVDEDQRYTYTISGCQFPNMEVQKKGFMAFNPYNTTPAISNAVFLPHGGERYGAAFAAAPNIGEIDQPENSDWLISPKLLMAAESENPELKFFVRSLGAKYVEKFKVLVSETDDNLESFFTIKDATEAPFEDWGEVTVDLSDWAGKEIHVAIQCVSSNGYMFMIDDISITKPTSKVMENVTVDANTSYYDLSGRKISGPVKGIYIVRHSDGTTKKMIGK